MNSATMCPQCGAAIPDDAIAGQCPFCLMDLALGAEEDPGDLALGSGCRQLQGYELGRQIGAGGMGAVYEAWRVADPCKVAIKLIRDSHVASPGQLRRFMIEGEAAARLNHPNIVRIHEISDWHGIPFISMEFIEGESLQAMLSEERIGANPSPESLAKLMAKVARAIHHAHLRGVLHRDLKPSNVLLDVQGEPRLTDFGLAKILNAGREGKGPCSVTATSDVAGTPSYMSPEQVSGADVGCAADIYGLGALLYALLTGRPPFQGATPLDTFRQIMDRPPPRPRTLNPAVPPDLELICLKCLEKEPCHRYVSASDLAADLDRFAAGRRVQARPLSAVRRSRQWIKRNPVGASLIASLCFGLIVALTLLKIVNDQRRQILLDRDLTFEEGMDKISQIWRDPATKSVTITARELLILSGRSTRPVAGAHRELCFGASADDGPSSMAQRYARLLGELQERMSVQTGRPIAFHLRLLKRFSESRSTLARGEVDFMVLEAADFLRAKQAAPGVAWVAHLDAPEETVVFAGLQSGIRRLDELRGKSIAFPDPDQSLTIAAKARMFDAGLREQDLSWSTNIANQGPESGATVLGNAETVDLVLRGVLDAGVTRRGRFERHRHLGLVALDRFSEAPCVLAAREGLDPQMVAAIRDAIRAMDQEATWPEGKFIALPDSKGESVEAPQLEALRQAMSRAKRFHTAIGSED